MVIYVLMRKHIAVLTVYATIDRNVWLSDKAGTVLSFPVPANQEGKFDVGSVWLMELQPVMPVGRCEKTIPLFPDSDEEEAVSLPIERQECPREEVAHGKA